MAAQVLLLLALICGIQAEVIRRAQWPHSFIMDDTADFCSVSRWTGSKKELLWNSSDFSYEIRALDVSYSGQYQEQCWTRGNLMLERNSTLLVCDDQKTRDQTLYLNVGQTVELTCDGVGPNQSFQWAYMSYETYSDGLLLIDDEMPSDESHLVKNKPLVLTAHRSSIDITYYCLVKKQLRCDLHCSFHVYVPPEYILRSVGESLELNCSDDSRNQTHKWRMDNSLRSDTVSHNSTLMLPSLTLEHTGVYTCDLSVSGRENYHLFVCPEAGPPAVEQFSGGENLTLRCGDGIQTAGVHWFMQSNRTEGRVFYVDKDLQQDNTCLSNTSLVIRNVSLQDSGLFWCVGLRGPLCVFRSETLVMFREPGVDHHVVRSVLLSVVILVMLCVVVVVMVWRSWRREQLPAPVEEMEMSQLSPESDMQEQNPV